MTVVFNSRSDMRNWNITAHSCVATFCSAFDSL